MDKETMRESLSNLFDEVVQTGDALRKSIIKLNEYYSDNELPWKSHVGLFTGDYHTFLDNWEEISVNLDGLLTAARNVNKNLLGEEVLEPQNDSNEPGVLMIVESMNISDASEYRYVGRIEGDDCDLKFSVITDRSKLNTEEGMVKAIRIFDSDSRDLLIYRKPGTIKVISDNSGDLVEYYIKLLRKFDTKIPSEG